ncbi:MAG: hypothetical protein KC435_08520 [Thermomicrobiales bacterium]|nr:hypothetical protein [Thermomicrobiales bacterium]
MSKQRPDEPKREYTPGEQQQSFIQRRYTAFADRSRDPGDALTWAIVLGAFIGTLLLVCFAVAGQARYALVSSGVFLLWVVVVSYWGRVNVASILWGSSTADSNRPPNPVYVYHPTFALVLFALICAALDVANGRGFGWYGVVLIFAAIAYLALYLRSFSSSTS